MSFERRIGLWERMVVGCHRFVCEFCRRWKQQVEAVQNTVKLIAKRFEDGVFHRGKGLEPDAKDRIKKAIRNSND